MTTFGRLSRLRATPALRELTREVRLHPQELVAPLFVTDAPDLIGPIGGLPGVIRHDLAAIADVVGEAREAGLRGVMLFGVPGEKDEEGREAWSDTGVVQRALRSIRDARIDVALIADLCLCQYRADGRCASPTEPLAAIHGRLAAIATSQAAAGADLVAPSGMVDGGVRAIREGLDAAGHDRTGILAYSVKHASALYGPFRRAARSTSLDGHRATAQLDVANAGEALREAEADIHEGADLIMVKPAGTNLDTLARLRIAHPGIRLAAFDVSGEYAARRAAAAAGVYDLGDATIEALIAVRRAGAGLIVSYDAVDIARGIRSGAWS